MSRVLDFFKSLGSVNDPDKLVFAKVTDEPLQVVQALLDDFLKQNKDKQNFYGPELSDSEAGMRIAAMKAEDSRLVVLAVISRLIPLQARLNEITETTEITDLTDYTRREELSNKFKSVHWMFFPVLRALLRRKLPLTEADIVNLQKYILSTMQGNFSCYLTVISGVIKAIELYQKDHDLSETIQGHLKEMDRAFEKNAYGKADERKQQTRVLTLLSDNSRLNLVPGEAWSDVAIDDIGSMNEASQQHWACLLQFCQTASNSKPGAKWKKQAREYLNDIDGNDFEVYVSRWFKLVEKPHNALPEDSPQWMDADLMLNEQHMDILKGLCWCCSFYESDELARAMYRLALTSYKKIAGRGPRAIRVGNACVYALGEVPGMVGVYQLALLKVRVNCRSALTGIEKALAVAGERVGMSVDELEEMGVPAYGMSEVGKLTETMGEFQAELVITGSNSTELRWLKADGKLQKSVPKAVKEGFAEELKEIKASAKDIQKMLPAQRQRIDNMFLQQCQWDLSRWRQYYLDHPLVGSLARRLIWKFSNGDVIQSGCFFDGVLLDANDHPLVGLADDTQVSLWHPIQSDIDEIKAWREWLERHLVIQPFKQAHREIYLLTDAERTTNTYSNRFAAHIIKQHQFNALALQRGWKYALQGRWDSGSGEIARLVLAKWGLWAEFWVEGIGEYETDTSDLGMFNYVATDQVRFYAYGSDENLVNLGWSQGVRDQGPVPIADIPPLLLSEVFRDVDLFVGVGSVGNDPEWSDGGPQGRYRDYWNSYSFGDLSATAKTRKEVLERLIPRLKIASRCELTDKFLLVRGDVRTYKIHLGSGNILMMPNDQYLCIVVARGKKRNDSKVFLPFEGDSMMSVILSKAFMLAEDKKIKDSTILSQIQP